MSNSMVPQSFRFMNLPLEIRREIYQEYFTAEEFSIGPVCALEQRLAEDGVDFRSYRTVDIFFVSREVYAEAEPLFWSSTVFSWQVWRVSSGNYRWRLSALLRQPVNLFSKIHRLDIELKQDIYGLALFRAICKFGQCFKDVRIRFFSTCSDLPSLVERNTLMTFRNMIDHETQYKLSFDLTFNTDDHTTWLRCQIDTKRKLTIVQRSPDCRDEQIQSILLNPLGLDLADITNNIEP